MPIFAPWKTIKTKENNCMQEFTFNDWLQDKLEIDFKRDWEFDSLVDHELRKQKVKEENENREKGSVRVRYEQKQLSKETYEKIIQHQELVGLRFIELGLQQKIERFRESIRNADPGDLAEIINEEITQQTEEFNRDLVTVDGLTSPARHITLSVKKREPLPVMHIKGSEYQKLEAEFEKMENGKEFSLKGLGSLPLRERLNRTIIHQFIEFLKGWSSKFDTDKEVAAQGGLVSLMKRHYPAHWGINGSFETKQTMVFSLRPWKTILLKG